MPKKARVTTTAMKELEMYMRDVEGPMFRLGIRLGRHFQETDDIRARIIALEKLFKAYLKDVKLELAQNKHKRTA